MHSGAVTEGLRAAVVQQVGQLPDGAAVAVVDWTSVVHACLLLDGGLNSDTEPGDAWRAAALSSDLRSASFDPFIALGDLASLVGAVILYDRVVAISQDALIIQMLGRLLKVEDAVVGLELDTKDRAAGRYSLGRRNMQANFEEPPEAAMWLKELLDEAWRWAWQRFDDPPWLGTLKGLYATKRGERPRSLAVR